VGTTEIETDSPPSDAQRRPSPDEIRYLAREVSRVVPRAARAQPIAVYGGVRPLLAAEEKVGEASREHRIVDDGPLLTIVGGKYTTFRVMARDVMAAAARKLKRETARAGTPAAPRPPAPDGPRGDGLAKHR